MSLIGKKVGPFKVISQIGSGGMAVVYKAEQHSVDRFVAIKELRSELARDTAIAARFEREALSMAQLRHQNIIHVYDFLERQNSMFIVMEYVEGVDLYTLMQQKQRLPADISAIIALQAARALEYAHYRGVIHRDFKPSNLMISKEGDVKLMDFGIARDEAYEDLTLPGQALGTPAYMSPEQILGERIDPRSDIFSFGIVLYQMLTGQKPFTEDETVGVMHRIVNKPYVRPRSVYPDVPWVLQRIVKRCLQKRPDKRYQSTDQLRGALERYVSKTVRLNFNGRLVVYLHNQHFISGNEARTFVSEDVLDAVDTVREDRGSLSAWRAVIKPMLVFNVMALLALVGWTLGIEYVHPTLGYVRLNAVPWAEVFVDGRFHDITPFEQPIALPSGKHKLEFRNAHMKSSTRFIEVRAGETKTMRIDLKEKRHK